MSTRHFSDWIKAYLDYCYYSEAPDTFHFWTGVSTIAGALRRRVWIDQGYFKWHPNFYIIFVAPPGVVSKSTTAGIGMGLLKHVKGIKFGADATTWQALAQTLAKARETFQAPDGKIMSQCAITLLSSELGTLLKPQDTEMMDVLVSLWDGTDGAWTKATKTQGNDEIVNPWINIIGCTTPSWIGQNVPEYMIGGGFTSRTIFVYADTKRRLVAYPGLCLPKDQTEHKEKLIEDLRDISNMCGPMYLSKDAIAWGEAWYEQHYTNPEPHLQNPRYGGYVARKQTHIHKLAMVLAAAECSSLEIQAEHLERAAALVTATEVDMPKVFSMIGKDPSASKTESLLNWLQAHGPKPEGSAWQHFLMQMSLPDFKAAIQAGVAAGLIKQEVREGQLFLIPLRHNTRMVNVP